MKKSFILYCLALTVVASAQQTITIEEVIGKAMRNNFNIQVVRNNADIDRINNTAGNAGMLPIVSLNGVGVLQSNDVHSNTSSLGKTHTSNLTTRNLGANVELNWTLYDGGKMFVTKNKLSQIEGLGEIKFKEQVLRTMYDVIAAYYDVVRQKQQLKALNEVVNYNRERVKIAQLAFTSGISAKTDLLQAKIDLNVYTENVIIQEATILSAKRTLNVLLNEASDCLFEVSDSIPLNFNPDQNELKRRLFSENSTIRKIKMQIDIAKLNVKEIQSAVLPQFSFRTGYYFSNTTNSAGITLQNQVVGPQIGGVLSFPLFSGGENHRKINVAKMGLKTVEKSLENTMIELDTELQNALTEFDIQKQMVEIEKENNLLTKENLEISLQRLRFGQTTSLEVHQAQESFVQSATRLTNFKYNLKIAEARLKQLLASL